MNRRGVTLIELLIVMIIIGIAALFFVPNMGAWLPNYRLRSTARDIVSTMRTAQMKAVSTNLEYRVYFTASGGKYWYWIERGDKSDGSTNWHGTISPSNDAIDGQIAVFPDGVTNSFAGFIEFNPDSTSTSGSLTLQNSRGTTRLLTITPSTGRVAISTP